MKTGNAALRKKINELTPDEKEKLQQYAESVKEIKKEINTLLNKSKVNEEGGNKSSGLYLDPNK